MSSRLIPPKVGSSAETILTIPSTVISLTSMSKTSMSAKRLKSSPFPSITGFPATAPILPNPRTAVPLEITPTRFPFAVYL